MAVSVEELGRGFPNEFVQYLNYVRSLRFEEMPNYAYLRSIFRDLFIRGGFQYDYIFDWELYKLPGLEYK